MGGEQYANPHFNNFNNSNINCSLVYIIYVNITSGVLKLRKNLINIEDD